MAKNPEFSASTGYEEAKSDSWGKENVEVYNDYRGAREPRYKNVVENDRFYHNIQFDEAEEQAIIARGQAPVPINVMYSIIKQMTSLLTSDAPYWYVDPVGDSDKKVAYILRKLLYASWYNSKGGRHLSQISKEMLIGGVGYGAVNPWMTDSFGVKFGYIPYHQVFVSPMTREFDFSDSENLIICKILSTRQASKLLGISEKKLEEYAKQDMADNPEAEVTYSPRYVSPISKIAGSVPVRVIQRMTIERRKIYTVRALADKTLPTRVYFNLTSELEAGRGKNWIITETEQDVLAKYISVGKYCQRYYYPINTYNVVPFIDEFNGNPYCLGEVDYLYGVQRSLNKFVLLAILNATLSNTMKVMAVKGTIDRKYYEENYAVPGSLVEYEWSEGQPPPKELSPAPLSGSFFEFPRLLMYVMEYMTGIFGVVQGDTREAPRTASGLMSLQNYGGQKVKLIGRNMADSLSTLGDVAVALYQNYAPYDQIVSYFDESEAQNVQVVYNTLRSKNGAMEIENNVSSGKFKARVRPVQSYGSERNMTASLLANLAAQTRSPALIKPILKLADVPEADQIASEIDTISQLQQTVTQMQENQKRLEQINRQLQNEIIQKSQDVSLARFEEKLGILLEKVKGELGMRTTEEIASVREDLIKARSEEAQPTE